MPKSATSHIGFTVRQVGEFWGQVLDATGEVRYDGLDMSEAVQLADSLNGNDTVSRNHYNGVR